MQSASSWTLTTFGHRALTSQSNSEAAFVSIVIKGSYSYYVSIITRRWECHQSFPKMHLKHRPKDNPEYVIVFDASKSMPVTSTYLFANFCRLFLGLTSLRLLRVTLVAIESPFNYHASITFRYSIYYMEGVQCKIRHSVFFQCGSGVDLSWLKRNYFLIVLYLPGFWTLR